MLVQWLTLQGVESPANLAGAGERDVFMDNDHPVTAPVHQILPR